MIVLIEDGKINQLVIAKMLAKLTKQPIIIFSTGKEAIEFIKYNINDIDLVILDGNLIDRDNNLALPLFRDGSFNGPDVAAEIINIEKDIPITVWTTDSKMLERFGEVFERHKKSYHILNKPVVFKDLSEVLAKNSRVDDDMDSSAELSSNQDITTSPYL